MQNSMPAIRDPGDFEIQSSWRFVLVKGNCMNHFRGKIQKESVYVSLEIFSGNQSEDTWVSLSSISL